MGCFFFQAEDGIRDLVRSRGLGDVYKRQAMAGGAGSSIGKGGMITKVLAAKRAARSGAHTAICLLYTSDAADERSSVDLGGRRIIKKKTTDENPHHKSHTTTGHRQTHHVK